MADTATLDDDVERAIDALMRSGRYASRSDVLRESLWLLERRERKLQELDAALARSLADEEAGRVVPAEKVFDELRARIRAVPSNYSE